MRKTPPTMTCSTLDTSADRVTAATGSWTGATPIPVASMTTTSACLPTVSEPVRSSTPATWAPSRVAIRSMSRAVSIVSGVGVPSSHVTALTRARSAAKAARIWVNMSPGTVVTTSTDRLGRSSNCRALLTGGQPWPIWSSTWGAIEIIPPVSLTRCHSCSLK